MDFFKKEKIPRSKFAIIIIAVALFAGMTFLLFNSEKKKGEVASIPLVSEGGEITSEDKIAMQIMKSQLEKSGILDFVLSMTTKKDEKETKTLVLIYKSETGSEQKFREEMALISGTFIGIKKYKQWEINEFAATVKNEKGEIEGTWNILESWISDYINGDMVDQEFVSKIMSTYKVL